MNSIASFRTALFATFSRLVSLETTGSQVRSVLNFERLPSGLIRLLTLILLVVSGAIPAESQPFFPPYVERGIDSSLSSILMTRYDLEMSHDAAGDDIHRFSHIKQLFADPLSTFSLTDTIARTALSSFDEPMMFFRYLRSLLDLNQSFPNPGRITVRDKEIGIVGRLDISKLNYTEQTVLRRFLALAIATDVLTSRAKSELDQDTYRQIVDYSDTLLIQSEDDGESDLIEMRYAERYATERADRFFNQDIAGIDYSKLLSPGVAMYAQALEYARTMEGEIPNFQNDIRTGVWDSPLGLIAIGGPGDDVYTGDFFCIVDVGGNDIYRARPLTKQDAAARSTTLIIDFSGNDTYVGEDYAFGGTLFGASTVIDLAGDDSYSARNFSLGCGFFGVGILHDQTGSDRYTGGTGVEGAGMFGLGMIVEGGGNDSYYAHLTSQGFGYTRGLGIIVEHGGNDQYISSSPYTDYLRYDNHFESFCQGAALGSRPVASGGFGIIAEDSGNDLYYSDIFGQGTGYWYGLGGIVDNSGSDNYTSYQYAQGSGVHLAFGSLIDKEGNDNYVSHGVSQGCGHDIAFGGLYDRKGDDNYVVESLSLGGGNANAISLFIDAEGDDSYIARVDNTLGYSDLRRDYGMIGMFLDLNGHDFYGTTRGGNDSLWLGSYYGVGLDTEWKPEEEKVADQQKEEEEKKTPEQIQAELETDIPRLFIQASAAPQKYQYLVEPALKRLEEGADSTIPYLLSMLNSDHPREALALRLVLPRIGSRITPLLIDTIRNGDKSRVGMAIYILGQMKDSTAAGVIGSVLHNDSWRLRSTAAEALLKMNAVDAHDDLKRALHDPVDIVRGRSARAFARIADSSELSLLLPLLDDTSQIVRYQIGLGLKDRGLDSDAVARTFLVKAIVDHPETRYIYPLLLPYAYGLKDPAARNALYEGLIGSPNARLRADAIRLALAWQDPNLLRIASALRTKEQNSEVLYQIYKAEQELNQL